MAVMKVARVLRDKPSLDAAIIRSVPSGTKVTVLDDKKLPFTEILIDATGEKGWVVDEAIDKTRDTVGPLDKLLVAAECVELAANGTVRNSVRGAMMMKRRESSHGYRKRT
ncbi:SH3 domain-containing protein, partial [Rhizobium pisi]|uniref:SH3 domain-containing protein n=1 Tax=Rhizobium pisi TaxID=574561 RepID=UPI003CFEE058